ncbi:MAG TPA: hypothetical protein VH478_25240 [Trebonia sp.]|nr:hypothetical protein [Trebonia sp.]
MTRRRAALTAACAVIAAASLGLAVQAARSAHVQAARGPSAAELDQAERTAVAQRWERLPLGQVFPAAVGYATAAGAPGTATRLGIGAGDDCMGALDGPLQATAASLGCQGGLRATYADEPGGTVYTVGVLAFPDDTAAGQFAAVLPPPSYPATVLNALPLPGTAAARFGDPGRQFLVRRVAGPYVILAVSGYADGRPARPEAQPGPGAFAAAAPIAAAVAAPLSRPGAVDCADPEFQC